jgi:multiple antibiotic resistance protein
MCFITMFITLFLIIDAIGNIAPFLDILQNMDKKRYWKTVAIEMSIALGFMLSFYFLGEWLLDLLQLSEITVYIASGIILFLAALGVIYPTDKSVRVSSKKHQQRPFIVPLAVPLIAGPPLLATIILYSHIGESIVCSLGAIVAAWAASAIILLLGRYIFKWIGANGLIALERLFALILVIMATQRVMQGVKLFVVHHVTPVIGS